MLEDHGTDFAVAVYNVGAEIGTTMRRDERAKRYMSSTMPDKSDGGDAVAGRTATEDVVAGNTMKSHHDQDIWLAFSDNVMHPSRVRHACVPHLLLFLHHSSSV